MTIKLIIGLRNPGSTYENTRHNAGGWFAEALVKHYNGCFKAEKKLHAELATIDVADQSCKVALPLTFMNHSGLPAREICQFYRIQPNHILVVHDELDLLPGRIKLKTGGGHGGHNGLRDIVANLGSHDFHRLRIGIGHPGHKDQVLGYVLGKPSQQDKQLIFEAIDRAIDSIPTILTGTMANAMNLING
jgi:PTH1 family peptidyl-tRNA hydrolase